jgi:allantoin racemase
MKIHVIAPVTTAGLGAAPDVHTVDDCEVTHSTIATGPASIESEYEVALALPGTIAAALEAKAEGADAIVINCMCDPGLAALREALTIPVVGAGQASYHVASMLAHSFAVLVAEAREIPIYENNAKIYGLASKLRSVRSIDIPVLDLAADPDRVVDALYRESLAAIEGDRADALVLGCTGMQGCDVRLRARLDDAGYAGVPLVEPVSAAIALARAFVDLHLAHSKRTYPLPPAKAIVGFDIGGTRAPV